MIRHSRFALAPFFASLIACTEPVKPPSDVLCVGDSITGGLNAGQNPSNQTYPAYLQSLYAADGITVNVRNLGAPGYTMAQILTLDLEPWPDGASVDVVLQGGTNDYTQLYTLYAHDMNAAINTPVHNMDLLVQRSGPWAPIESWSLPAT